MPKITSRGPPPDPWAKPSLDCTYTERTLCCLQRSCKSQDTQPYLSVHLGQSEEQKHALFVIRGAFGSAGLKLVEQKVQLLFIEELRQFGQHAENIDPHRLERVRLHGEVKLWCLSGKRKLDSMFVWHHAPCVAMCHVLPCLVLPCLQYPMCYHVLPCHHVPMCLIWTTAWTLDSAFIVGRPYIR